jgi:hypothetical protein
MKPSVLLLVLGVACVAPTSRAESKAPHFRAVEIDSQIEIGYAVTVADVDGDKQPDILVVDKRQTVWYRNPTWEKFVLVENLTEQDNVCIAAADIDGDGKAEIAVGAGWNPGDTVNSGAVYYLIPPPDRTQKWEPVKLPHEPTVHRMRWVRNGRDSYDLVVVPLHGRGNKNGEGAGVKILAYQKPSNPHDPWKVETVNDSLHLTHNLNVVDWDKRAKGELLVAGKEGVFYLVDTNNGWRSQLLGGNRAGETNFKGAGEVRDGRLPNGHRFLATVEPMHGQQLVVYAAPSESATNPLWPRQVIDETLAEGHALACRDVLGTGSDQIIIGWRGKNAGGKVGIKIFQAANSEGTKWSERLLDDNGMACEDLCVADLNGDGKLDIIASGRATKNVKIYFNEGE